MKKAVTYLAVLVLGGVLCVGGQLAYAFERHPHLRAAMRELDGAREELRTAPHDFGGHREAAMRALDEAHHQIEECLKFER